MSMFNSVNIQLKVKFEYYTISLFIGQMEGAVLDPDRVLLEAEI